MPVTEREKRSLGEMFKVKREEKDVLKHTMTTKATLCYIFKGNQLLLQLKKIGKFGEGHWNAPGGKVKESEMPEDAAVREVKEETNFDVKDLRLVGRLFFVFEEEEEHNQEVYVFTTKRFMGKMKQNEEGELSWFEKDKIPLDLLWPSDIYWLPMLLAGKSFTGSFYYDRYKDLNITKYEIKEGLQS